MTKNKHLSIPTRLDIDGLRALAILLVLVFHVFPKHLPGGFIGVDIFFVISGFLISSIIFNDLNNDAFSIKDFYCRRAIRLLPALLLVLLTSLLFSWLVLLSDEYQNLGKYVAAGAGFSANIALWLQVNYFDTSADLMPLLHLWSLGVEEQFYFIWPLTLLILYRRQYSMPLFIALIIIGSFIISVIEVNLHPGAAFYLPQTRLWELAIGGALGYLHSSFFTYKNRLLSPSQLLPAQQLASLIGLTFIIVSAATVNRLMPYPGINALLPVLGATLIIAAGSNTFINRLLLSSRGMVWIGKISYPLYLWHWPLISFARILEQGDPSAKTRNIVVLASFFLAAATYYFVETPLRRLQNKEKLALVLTFLLFCTGMAGFIVYQKGGLPQRDAAKVIYPIQAAKTISYFNSPDDCKLFQQHTNCIYSLTKPSDLLIIGDSHAAHLWIGFHNVFPGKNIGIIEKHGTPPILNFGMGENPQEIQHSEDFTASLLRPEIFKPAKVILVSARYNYYNKLYETGVDKNYVSYHGKKLKHGDFSFWEAGLRDTFSHLTNTHSVVIFSYSVPELRYKMKDNCMDARRIRLRSKPLLNCDIPRGREDVLQGEVRGILMSILRDYPQILVFDPYKYFCDEQMCYATHDGLPLYYDDDHLSVSGSEFYARSFKKEFPWLFQ